MNIASSKYMHYIILQQRYHVLIIAETDSKQTNVSSDGVTIIDSNLDLLTQISTFDGHTCQQDKGMTNQI